MAITYGEESGEPEKAEVSIKEKGAVDSVTEYVNEHRDEILKAIEDMKTCYPGSPFPCCQKAFERGDTTQPGKPFEFKPTQVHPVVTEGGE